MNYDLTHANCFEQVMEENRGLLIASEYLMTIKKNSRFLVALFDLFENSNSNLRPFIPYNDKVQM